MMNKIRSVQLSKILVTRIEQAGLESLLNLKEKWNAYSLPVSKIGEQETKEDAAWRIVTDAKELGLPENMEKPRYLGQATLNQKSERPQEVTEFYIKFSN